MVRTIFSESGVEKAALDWFNSIDYPFVPGNATAPGEPNKERGNYSEVLLLNRLRNAVDRLNSHIPTYAQEEAIRKIQHPKALSLIRNNRWFHNMLINGIEVEYQREDGSVAGDKVWLIDFDDPDANDWLVVNQFTVVDGQQTRRPDVVVFVNGLPLAVIELKNAADENTDIWDAYNQLQTYKQQIPSLITYNELLIISDGLQARVGSLTAGTEWFMPWRTIEGERFAPDTVPELEVMIKGIFDKRRFLDLLQHYIVFQEDDEGSLIKKIAGYHQYHAVNEAVETTVEATRADGDRRCGVVWHTQGSGKSLTMAFYAGRLAIHPEMENPTIVVITDRIDLDDQLFETFAQCSDLLRQKPEQATTRADLRDKLDRVSGGVIFTTIQKFLPLEDDDTETKLSDRRNIVVIADEAHRSQYDLIDGFARYMRDTLPNASFIGFTGTPVELSDRNTRTLFGDYIDVYDIMQAVEDGATVRIYYDSRLAKLELNEEEKPHLDPDFEEVTEGEEIERKESLKTKWAALEAVVGSEKRIELIARDLVDHYEKRLEALEGKAMVVCMSRRICVDLYNAIAKLRPEWHSEDDDKGEMKIVMSGSASDPIEWQQHIRSRTRRKALAERFKKPGDPFKIVIVRDMWLTGFDAPCLHTMYIDKPMHGHSLMQAIARVNRVFKDKPGGLVVDYLGLAAQLKKALADYTQSGGKGRPTYNQEEAVAVMLEKYEICCGLFHSFDWSAWTTGSSAEKLSLLPAAQEHILKQNDGKERLLQVVLDLSKAFALAVPHPDAIAIRDDVSFFQAVRAALVKSSATKSKTQADLDQAIRQIVSRAISSDGVIDIFSAAGLKKPDISILSDEFLAEVRDMPQRNLAVELLQKLLNDEIKTRSKRNVVQARSFTDLLEKSIKAYHNKAIESAQVIEEMISLAKEMREADKRGEELGLSVEETAFYDALTEKNSVEEILGNDELRLIAHELSEQVRRNVTIDWTVKESVRAKLRVMIKRILRKHGYPPDLQNDATKTVLEQAEILCADWAG